VKVSDIIKRLGRLDLHAVAQTALHEQAEMMAGAVREALLQSGDASRQSHAGGTSISQESVGVSVAGDEVLIGSNSDAAVARELGTVAAPPQPFLASVAAEHAQAIGEAVGIAVANALRGA